MMTEVITKKVILNEEDLNRDPITGTPGAHPLGTGAGAASGGIAGAVIGTAVAGPIGTLIGGAVGAVAGGLAGKSAAEELNHTDEERFWKGAYVKEPYHVPGRNYDYYAPGFRAGWEGRVRHDGRSFKDAEAQLKVDYDISKSELDPDWHHIREAARAAWDRVDSNRRAKH